MEDLKMNFQHVMLWGFKNNENVTETGKKNCNFHAQNFIKDHQV